MDYFSLSLFLSLSLSLSLFSLLSPPPLSSLSLSPLALSSLSLSRSLSVCMCVCPLNKVHSIVLCVSLKKKINKKKKIYIYIIQVWKNMKCSKWWQNF